MNTYSRSGLYDFIVTSMFVERMEVLDYCQKFEVELTVSTFPDSTNTERSRKLVS